jgi:hypothetical protein
VNPIHLIERVDIQRGYVGIHVFPGIGHRHVPQTGLELPGFGQSAGHATLFQAAGLHEGDAGIDVLPQPGGGLPAVGFWQKVRSVPGGADGDRFLAHQGSLSRMAIRNHPKCKRQHEGRQAQDRAGHRADRRLFLVLRPPVS